MKSLQRFASFVVWKGRVPLILLLCALAFGSKCVFAADPSSIESDYVRTNFTIEDGLPDNTIDAILQTDNGLLWIGTESGLASFDGRIFTPVRLRIPGAPPPGAVNALATDANGDLWVGTDAGVVRIPKSDLNDPYLAASSGYRVGKEQSDEVEALLKARDGVMWAGTNHGLYRFDGHQFIAAIASAYVSRIEQALDGRLMLITGSGFAEYDGRKVTTYLELAASLGVGEHEIFDAFQDARGTMWYGTNKGIRWRGDLPLSRLLPVRQAHTATSRIYSDSRGTLWMCTGVGLYRRSGEYLQSPAPGLNPHAFYAGKDGDLWIGTNGEGLTHLQPRLVRVYTKADGLPNDIAMTVLPASDGRLWVGNNCGLSVFDGAHFKNLNEKDGLANSCVWALAEDHDHNIWIGTYGGGIFRYNGTFKQYTMEQGLISRIVFQITVARDNSLWIATPDGLSRMVDGRIHNYTTTDGLSSNRILDIHQDRAGSMWVATQGGIDRLTAGRFVRIRAAPGSEDVLARRLAEDSAGNLYATDAPRGISRIQNDEMVVLNRKLRLLEMVESPDHNVWFSSREGIIRMTEQELAQSGNQARPFSYEQINRADGLATLEASVGSPNIALAPDGKLWLGTVKGLAMIDTRKMPMKARKPKVFISDVLLDGERVRVRNDLVLPPGPHHLELQLAAVDLANAQKIRLQYRLEGVDSTWLEGNASRTAVYTNIPAGPHDLLLRATDSLGNWDEGNVVYQVTQRPFFYQTRLFQVSVVAAFALLLAAAYIVRVRHLVRQTRALLEERQVERESLARDLHDTFLQGIQGLILCFHTGAQQLSADHPVRQLFEEALQQSDKVMLEGRNVLARLRTRRATPQSLANALSAMGQEFRPLSPAQFEVVVSGLRRDLRAVVQEELQKIAREALFNSFRHAQAKKIEVELHFGLFELRLRFRDNGAGIDPGILREGSVPGHYGLPGMKERVREIGGHLDLWSRTGAGTEIEVRIPSAIAYRDNDARYARTFLRKFLKTRSS